MAHSHPFTPIKPFIGLIFSDTYDITPILEALSSHLGPIDHHSPILDFSHTSFYTQEMGTALKKQFFGFSNLLSAENATKTKLISNNIESQHTHQKQRQINIDPGMLSLHNIILFSTKNYAHRIPLTQGIYAELTLIYRQKKYIPVEWTYPDYKTKPYLDFFYHLRTLYQEQLQVIETCS